MYKLKEKKWSNGTVDYFAVHTDDPNFEEQIGYNYLSEMSYLEQAKAQIDVLNKTVVSERIIYP